MEEQQPAITEDEVRRRAEANGLTLEERYVPGIAKGMERTRAALASMDPTTLRDIEPAPVFRARQGG